MTKSTPLSKNATSEIERIDGLLSLNREMLIDAETIKPESQERTDKIAKVRGRINTLLDERIGWMAQRDGV